GVGVPVLPPDVNASTLAFRVESGGIRFGLAAVKNVGEGAVEQIVQERDANGAYTSLEEFCRRQDLHTINKRVIESLIKCGAMDGLGPREGLLDTKRLDSAIAAAQIDQKAASTGQVSLFDRFGGAETLTAKPVVTELDGKVGGGGVAAHRRAKARADARAREWDDRGQSRLAVRSRSTPGGGRPRGGIQDAAEGHSSATDEARRFGGRGRAQWRSVSARG